MENKDSNPPSNSVCTSRSKPLLLSEPLLPVYKSDSRESDCLSLFLSLSQPLQPSLKITLLGKYLFHSQTAPPSGQWANVTTGSSDQSTPSPGGLKGPPDCRNSILCGIGDYSQFNKIIKVKVIGRKEEVKYPSFAYKMATYIEN